jgi:hypothetical protein
MGHVYFCAMDAADPIEITTNAVSNNKKILFISFPDKRVITRPANGRANADRAIQETGGACESMLSCKTDSAKLKQAGGPVSSASISSARRGGDAKICVTYSDRVISRVAALAFTHWATIARTSLQHGVFVAGFFFAGAECMGHPLTSGADSVDGAKVASAQWFESSSQLLITRRVATQRLSMGFWSFIPPTLPSDFSPRFPLL